MTKLCWYEEDQYRKIVDDASHFVEKGAGGQPGLYLLGLKLLSMLVSEMNQPTPGRTLTQHRKIAVAFRDQSLLKTFQLSLSALKQMQASASADLKLNEQVSYGILHFALEQAAAWGTCPAGHMSLSVACCAVHGD